MGVARACAFIFATSVSTDAALPPSPAKAGSVTDPTIVTSARASAFPVRLECFMATPLKRKARLYTGPLGTDLNLFDNISRRQWCPQRVSAPRRRAAAELAPSLQPARWAT